MLYPCFQCRERNICKESCDKKADYMRFRKENVKRNRQWAKDSALLRKNSKGVFIMHDLDKVFSLVNTFLVSSSFFDILRKQLFFPENVRSIHTKMFSVREIESVDEMERIEFLAKQNGFYPTDYLFVLREPLHKKKTSIRKPILPLL